MNIVRNDNSEYNLHDCCSAIVTGWCKSGIFLMLENGETAFAYNFRTLQPGSEVLCTIKKFPVDEGTYIRVSIDHVYHYGDFPPAA